MELSPDLSEEALADVLPDRPLRTYPALLSTEADALAWARAGAPEGAVVVADYQASPRGRAGWPWEVEPGRDLAFSIVLRPRLSAEREGWLYTVAVSALADVCGEDCAIEWPDEARRHGARAAAAGVQAELGAQGVLWAVVNLLVPDARQPRGELLARVIAAIEHRYRSRSGDVLADYTPRCETIGRRVRARLVPLGPSGPQVTGTAMTALKDGALVLETAEGRRIAVRPQNLGLLEEAIGEPGG